MLNNDMCLQTSEFSMPIIFFKKINFNFAALLVHSQCQKILTTVTNCAPAGRKCALRDEQSVLYRSQV